MVRLIQAVLKCKYSDKFKFQFHYGTIDTLAYSHLIDEEIVSIPLWYDWYRIENFTGMITIKSFNSTMVRLIQKTFKGIGIRKMFQFHYGTIDTSSPISICLWHIPVSIPLWYDWYKHVLQVSENNRMFQFHYGTIDTFYRFIAFANIIVSIPLWYDWYIIVIQMF